MAITGNPKAKGAIASAQATLSHRAVGHATAKASQGLAENPCRRVWDYEVDSLMVVVAIESVGSA